MRTTIARSAAVLAAVAAPTATLLAAAPSAHAETTTFTDEVGDAGRFGDVASVATKMSPTRVTVTTTFAPRAHFSDLTTVYYDVEGRSEGPELVAVIDTDAFGAEQTSYEVYDAAGFDATGEPRCSLDNARVETRGQDSITLPVPQRCFTAVDSVRVSVETEQYVGGRHDWAPGRHRFGPITHEG